MKRIVTIEEIRKSNHWVGNYTARERKLYRYSNDALCAFLRKTDRIMSGRMVHVEPLTTDYTELYMDRIEKGTFTIEEMLEMVKKEPVAYTDRRHITINYLKLWILSEYDMDKFIPMAKAMNFHEFAHILYTLVDMEKDVLPYSIKHGIEFNLLRNIINWLEDMRIETIFTAIYPKSIDYFTITVLTFVKYYNWNWIYTYGRKYLSKKFRDMHVKQMDNVPQHMKFFNSHFKEISALIDEYITCMDKNRMLDIAREIIHLLPEEGAAPAYSLRLGEYSQSDSITSNSRKERKLKKDANLKDVIEKIKEQIEKEQKQQKQQMQELDNDANENATDYTAKKNDNGKENRDNDKEEIMAGGDDETETNEEGKEEGNKDAGNNNNNNNNELKKIIEEEMGQKLQKLEKEAINDQMIIEAIDGKVFPYSNKIKTVGNRLAHIIEKLRNDMGAAYTSNERSGRINIRQAMAADKTGKTRIFDKYHSSKINKTRMAVILHIDKSGSMADKHSLTKAMRVAKALTYGFDKVGCKTKIYAFDHRGYVIKDWHNKEFPKLQSSGGTSPIGSLINAVKDFEYAKKRWGIETFVNIVITDGDWDEDYSHSSDSITGSMVIRLMNKMGVNTVEIYINSSGWNDGICHGSKTFKRIKDIDDLPECVEKIVRNIANELRRKYRKK